MMGTPSVFLVKQAHQTTLFSEKKAVFLKNAVALQHEKHHELGTFRRSHPHLGQFFYFDERRTRKNDRIPSCCDADF